MDPDPEYRLSITEVMHHPYFNTVKNLPQMYLKKREKKAKNLELKPPANNLGPA